MYRIQSEWDFGHENLVFSSQADALVWLEEDENVMDLCTDNECDVQKLIADGLISFQKLKKG